jgi:S1-C subfamily serine protease
LRCWVEVIHRSHQSKNHQNRPEAQTIVIQIHQQDIIIELAGRKVENIYDYTYAIEALKVGQEVEVVVQRGSVVLRLKVTPLSRQ